MHFKILSQDHEFEQYQSGFLDEYFRLTQNKGTPIPSLYLRGSKVVGVFDKNKVMVAGYILNSTLPLRLLDFVPEASRENLLLPQLNTWKDCVEVTCVWKTPDRVSNLFMTARFWPKVQLEILSTRKPLMLGHTQNAKLNQFYTWAHPTTLYQGISSFGLPSHLFVYQRWQIAFCYVMLYLFETPRRALKQRLRHGRK